MKDQGNKLKLYFQSKKNVMTLEQLYSYHLREGSIMDSFREEKNLLREKLYDLKVSTFNWNKLMYYVDVADYKVE